MRYFIILMCSIVIVSPTMSFADGDESNSVHKAAITEVLNGGGYTYIRCKENGVESWIASTQVAVTVGDLIEYPDGPATYNFKSDIFGNKFTKIYFVPGIRKITKREALQNGLGSGQADVFKSVDESGTLVFTDDPSKLPGKKRGR